MPSLQVMKREKTFPATSWWAFKGTCFFPIEMPKFAQIGSYIN
jgi:hypothetical protein